MWGVAEDHDSNPIKLGLGKLKSRGAKIVAINPVRTGYGAIADEWVPINPGTDGLLAGAFIHELLRTDRVDLEYLVRYTNAHHLVIRDPGAPDDGMIARDEDGHGLCAARADHGHRVVRADAVDIAPLVVGEYVLADGRHALPAFQLFAERYLSDEYAPDTVAATCGVDADTIRRLARELAEVAFEQAITLQQRWTDAWGREHATMTGRPVAMHAMRGISAHANGFHTCRALHLLQMILGAIDTPGSFRYQPPYPKSAPPPNRPGKTRRANGTLEAAPLGYVHTPDDLVVDAAGEPRRLDKAFSWQHPFAAHGMERGTMQKCTLCVDRIYNETLDEADRQPACVMACPTRARHFGDLGDTDSAVSKLVAERDGYALMPEYDYKPVNRYLPPRPRRDGCSDATTKAAPTETLDTAQLPGVLRWLDRVLSR